MTTEKQTPTNPSFRVRYNEDQRPTLRLGRVEYPVLESTKRHLLIIEPPEQPILAEDFQGTLILPKQGSSFAVHGCVQQRDPEVTVVLIRDPLHTTAINRRGRFRIKYPIADRLILDTTEGQSLTITELAETGLRFLPPDDVEFEIGHPLIGVIFLHDDPEPVKVAGEILRYQPPETVLRLIRGVPLPKIINEQKYLLQKYPRVDD